MKVFSVSVMCYNMKTGLGMHASVVKTARSKHEVEGQLIEELQTVYPAIDGWSNYDAKAIELSTAALSLLLAATLQKES